MSYSTFSCVTNYSHAWVPYCQVQDSPNINAKQISIDHWSIPYGEVQRHTELWPESSYTISCMACYRFRSISDASIKGSACPDIPSRRLACDPLVQLVQPVAKQDSGIWWLFSSGKISVSSMHQGLLLHDLYGNIRATFRALIFALWLSERRAC